MAVSAASLPVLVRFTLPDIGRTTEPQFSSQEVLNQYPLLILLVGQDLLKRDSSLTFLRLAISKTVEAVARLVVISPDKEWLKRITLKHRTAVTTAPIFRQALLWDEQSLLRHQLDLQSRYRIFPRESVLLSIDRAGWLRRVEKVQTGEQVLSAVRGFTDPTPKLKVGEPAPDFAMADMNGISRRPQELIGKKNLLITFFPKCFTGTCAKQLESLRDARAALQAADIAVWGVSVDPAEGEKGQRAFAAQLQLWFPLLPDTGRHLSILYGAALSPNQTSSRMSVLIDKQGVVRWIDKQINPTTHGMDVVEKVKEMTKDERSKLDEETLSGCSATQCPSTHDIFAKQPLRNYYGWAVRPSVCS